MVEGYCDFFAFTEHIVSGVTVGLILAYILKKMFGERHDSTVDEYLAEGIAGLMHGFLVAVTICLQHL